LPVTLPETIVRRRCAALIPYARNARTHSDQQVAQIAASIREFGFTNPVLIDEEDGIIAGHGRVLAAHLLGLDEVPCIVLAHLTPAQRRAYVLADNKLALNAGWDLEMLSLEIGELGEAGFDLSLTGFDEFELGELFAERTQGRTDPQRVSSISARDQRAPGTSSNISALSSCRPSRVPSRVVCVVRRRVRPRPHPFAIRWNQRIIGLEHARGRLKRIAELRDIAARVTAQCRRVRPHRIRGDRVEQSWRGRRV